jgi:hypothetical protein
MCAYGAWWYRLAAMNFNIAGFARLPPQRRFV